MPIIFKKFGQAGPVTDAACVKNYESDFAKKFGAKKSTKNQDNDFGWRLSTRTSLLEDFHSNYVRTGPCAIEKEGRQAVIVKLYQDILSKYIHRYVAQLLTT